MPNAGAPPFQYSKRADMLARLEGQMLAAATEDRDRELEDFLASGNFGSAAVMGWDFKGTIATPGPPTSVQAPSPVDGDLWIDSNGIGWAWNGSAWVNVGTVRGPAGPIGPQGPPGPTSTQSFVYNQSTPSATWTIDHNLGFYPNVTVVDSAGSIVEGDAAYPTINRIVLTFNASFSGVAYLS